MDERAMNILVIEDSENDFRLLTRALSKEIASIDARRVDTVESLQAALTDKPWDVVISDNNVPDHRVSPKSSFELLRNMDPNVPFIIVSGTIEEENAVQLMKLGVNDYILKDSLARLAPAIKREVAEAASRMKKVEAEQKLTTSEQRYRMLAESIKDMFFATDRNLICTFWNGTAEKITRIKAADAIGKHLFDVLPIANTSPIRERIFESMSTLKHTTLEVVQEVENTRHFYEVTLYPAPDMHSVMVKDITATKRIARELKSVNEELETFIYRVSHDIRGPLASMQGIVNLAKTESFAPPATDFFSRIGQMTERMDTIIHNLHDIVRIKQDDTVFMPVPLHHIWHTALQDLQESAQYFTFDSTEPHDINLVTDQKLLVIALHHIFNNAITFRHPFRDPSVQVQYSRINSKYHQIVITDNGLGIEDNQMDKIFSMFYRGSEQSTGSGLGLYLAQSAITRMGGSIHATSIPGKGSVFVLRWPQSV